MLLCNKMRIVERELFSRNTIAYRVRSLFLFWVGLTSLCIETHSRHLLCDRSVGYIKTEGQNDRTDNKHLPIGLENGFVYICEMAWKFNAG